MGGMDEDGTACGSKKDSQLSQSESGAAEKVGKWNEVVKVRREGPVIRYPKKLPVA